MNRDDIIRMAREAGLVTKQFANNGYTDTFTNWFASKLERFAAIVAASEREAAKTYYEMSDEHINKVIQAAVDAEREDAERYRWLRDNNARFSWNPSRYNQETISGFAAFGTGYCGFEFETAVDKARSEE
jgi:hypothetical protein